MTNRNLWFRGFLLPLWFAVCLQVATAGPRAQQGDPSAPPIEHGKFVLYKFEQAIGQEIYEITPEGDSVSVKSDFKFTDRGTDVPLTVTFHGARDLTPQTFEIKGKMARPIPIDQAVEVKPNGVRLRNRDTWSDASVPAQPFFTIAGYAPATMQMLMVRYWATHGSPAEMATLPHGSLKVEPRGKDSFKINGKDEQLDRYTVEGLIWGRETLWLDSNRQLVALISTDAEFDHFEAIREGYESGLGDFVGRAGADAMSALTEFSKAVTGRHDETLVIMGGTLIDGTGAPAIPDSVVIVNNGKILAAGPRQKVLLPRRAMHIDATGKTIIPGLWDMHAHFEQVEWGPIYLASGVTTVRDCGNEFEFLTSVRDAIASGQGTGPRLLAAGVVDGTGPLTIGVERVDTPEQARQWVNRYHDAGFQQMKIYSSMKLEEVKAVADEAHRLGMSVTGHVPEGLNAYQVIEAGQDQINHIGYIADIMRKPVPADAKRTDRLKASIDIDLNSPEAQKAIAFLKVHHTVVDPTLALSEFFTATTAKPPISFEPGIAKVAPQLAQLLTDVGPPNPNSELMEKLLQKDVQIVGALHKAGIPVVAGTDQTVPGYSLHREMELYVQAGFTPMEAIQAATIVSARAMGLDKETGTIEAGKRADLIVINGDPLQDIHNTRNVEEVISNGKLYHPADLWASVGFKP